MYVIRVALRVTETADEAFRLQAAEQSREVRSRFAGCARYGFHATLDEPSTYLLYQEWRSREDFERYRESGYFVATREQLTPLLAGPPDSAYFAAERATP